MPQFLEFFDNPSNFLQGGITASLLAGSLAGSILTGRFLVDGIGRKRTLLLGSALFTLGCAVAAGAVNLPMLIAGRVINGLGNGCLTMTVRLVVRTVVNTADIGSSGNSLPKRNLTPRVSGLAYL